MAELARLAHLSERTLRRAEAGSTSLRTRTRTVNAFNRREERLKEYTVDEVFPNDTGLADPK